jgi:hypothetical protein
MNKRTAFAEMKKMRKIYEELGFELIGKKVFVEMNDAFWFNFETEKIGVAIHIPSDRFEDLIANYFDGLGANGLNPYITGFIHELGHYWSKKVYNFTNEDFHNALLEAELLDITSDAQKWTFEETLAKYYQIQTEFCANEFLKVAIMSKRNVIEKYNARIEEYYKEL